MDQKYSERWSWKPTSPSWYESLAYSTRRGKHILLGLEHFWKRWRKDYVAELTNQHRDNHTSIAVGDIVVVQEDNQPGSQWSLFPLEVSRDAEQAEQPDQASEETGRPRRSAAPNADFLWRPNQWIPGVGEHAACSSHDKPRSCFPVFTRADRFVFSERPLSATRYRHLVSR